MQQPLRPFCPMCVYVCIIFAEKKPHPRSGAAAAAPRSSSQESAGQKSINLSLSFSRHHSFFARLSEGNKNNITVQRASERAKGKAGVKKRISRPQQWHQPPQSGERFRQGAKIK